MTEIQGDRAETRNPQKPGDCGRVVRDNRQRAMQVPAAETIEMARDGLAALPQKVRDDQQRELKAAVGDASDELCKGYELGLQVARTMLAMNPAIEL